MSSRNLNTPPVNWFQLERNHWVDDAFKHHRGFFSRSAVIRSGAALGLSGGIDPVKQAAEYRVHAMECRRLAMIARYEPERVQLAQMADAWERMATEQERLVARGIDPTAAEAT